MDLRLYDTLTRDKRTFTPIDPANVRMYVCGPTVYDFAHIGNARPVIVFDVLFRLLRHLYGESHVTYVRNITDVDDKINDRAARDYPGLPLNDAIRKVTEKTEQQFHDDVDALGCLRPTVEPRATEFVLPRADGKADMKSLIQTLLDRHHAYFAIGTEGKEILFNVNSMPDYGALSGRKLEEQKAGARVEVDQHKRNPGDFVLWKESGAKQPGWRGEFIPDPTTGYDAEFVIPAEDAARYGRNSRVVAIHGRPGWHIECSAMSAAYLGNVFDIHGGGLDLIFPHHENEIAQSRCAHGTSVMANYWMHNGFLQVEGEKMSKSLGNFFTIRELLATNRFGGRKWPGEVLRLAMLKTHYRQPIDWTVKRLEEAHSEWVGLQSNWVRRGVPERGRLIPSVVNALCDDMNTHRALAELSRCDEKDDVAATIAFLGLLPDSFFDSARAIADAQTRGVRGALDRTIQEVEARERRTSLERLGLSEETLEGAILARTVARANKDWKESDRIRDELAAMGVVLKDGKDKDGKPVTTWEIAR